MTQEEKNEIIARAYRNIASGDELLAQPRPEPQEWPRARHKSFAEARDDKRFDELESNLRTLRQATELLADDIGAVTGNHEKQLKKLVAGAGSAMGEIRKQLRDEFQAALAERDKRIDELAGELGLMRALQPKRLLRKSVVHAQINGSVGADGHDALN